MSQAPDCGRVDRAVAICIAAREFGMTPQELSALIEAGEFRVSNVWIAWLFQVEGMVSGPRHRVFVLKGSGRAIRLKW